MLKRAGRIQQGLSLIELLVGVVVGMIVVAGVTAIYVTTVRAGTYTLRAAKLNEELRATMDIIVNDVRRAGHSGSTALGVVNPFTIRTSVNPTDLSIHDNGTCVVFTYDASHKSSSVSAGVVEGADFSAYRRNGDVIQMLNASSITNTTNCPSGSVWEALTDSNTVIVDSLSFSTSGSRCLNSSVSPEVAWSADAGSLLPACENEAGKRTGYVAPDPSNVLFETRQIVVRIVGHHKDDAATTLTVEESVRVMNDRRVN